MSDSNSAVLDVDPSPATVPATPAETATSTATSKKHRKGPPKKAIFPGVTFTEKQVEKDGKTVTEKVPVPFTKRTVDGKDIYTPDGYSTKFEKLGRDNFDSHFTFKMFQAEQADNRAAKYRAEATESGDDKSPAAQLNKAAKFVDRMKEIIATLRATGMDPVSALKERGVDISGLNL